jgi:hypothetical protein
MLYVIEAQHHEELIQEVSSGVETYGRTYKSLSSDYEMRARPIEEIPWE